MKKLVLFIFVNLLCFFSLKAQTATYSTINFPNAYTNTITTCLYTANFRSGFVFQTNGSINMGMLAPFNIDARFRWLAHDGGAVDYSTDADQIMYLNTYGDLWLKRNLFVATGSVGIGTATPQSKLAVNGTITATEVKVTQTGWSDFVFDSAYRLPNLSATSAYIKANNHLPGIPSAKEIESKGLNLGDMEKRQMQKIEELTLYQITANDRAQRFEKELSELKAEVGRLKNNSESGADNSPILKSVADAVSPTSMSSIEMDAGLNNSSTRPAVSAGTIAGEIRGISGNGPSWDDGFLRLSAGGGTDAGVKSYIDLSGFNVNGTSNDMYQNIVFGTSGSEAMRIKYDHSIIAQSSITALGDATFEGNSLHVGNEATGNVGFEFGSFKTPEETYLDFHSSGTGSDYDARIDAVGGNATSGQGTLQFIAGSFSFNNAITSTRFITQGGTSSQFLKADGSVDGTAYLPVSGGTITGNLGIGTASPQSKLAVNGTITATQVKVTQTGWSDFVFDSAYHLPALSKTAEFIKANHHLPDIPSTKEIESNGLDLGSMEKKQMQKIEELTLYQINADKKIRLLEKRLSELENEVKQLKSNSK